jgi:2',3'-cyclic-nucleotide 2'-phosphodiesterase (5'-nucleotidase family)
LYALDGAHESGTLTRSEEGDINRAIRRRERSISIGLGLRRLAAALFGLALAGALAAQTLTILHTSDLHGHVDPLDEPGGRDRGEGLARVATAVRAVRGEGRPVLLLDSGDAIQGTPTQALVFSGAVPSSGDPTIRAMNLVGYDAMAVGNHEFDFGLKRLAASRGEAKFPWLSANIVGTADRPAFEPYVVRTVEGVRVGILGLTTPTVPSWEASAHLTGLRFVDAVEAARKFVPVLRGKERCDVVVVLVHEGFERNLDTGAARDGVVQGENEAYALATEVPGIDLLLTGHTHVAIEPRKLGPTWVSQPGRFGNTLTRFDLTLEKKGGGRALFAVAGRNLSMKDVVPDEAVMESTAAQRRAAQRILSETVATLETPVSSRSARVADSAVLDWLHAVQREQGRADLSFASLLPGSLPDWPAGPLTEGQIWDFYPYENTLVTVRATGKQVRAALEVAARCIGGVGVEEGKPVWHRSGTVWGYNCDTLDGAEYALDPGRPEGNRLLFLRRDGREVRDEATFTVALNSYRAAGGGGFQVWRKCPRVFESAVSLRDLLIEDARRRRVLRLEANRNWFLAPSLPEGRFTPN